MFAIRKFLMWIIQFAVALSRINFGHVFYRGSYGSSGAEPAQYSRNKQSFWVRFANPTLTLFRLWHEAVELFLECSFKRWI